MIVTSHEQYRYVLLSVTFDLCQGHRLSAKFEICYFHISRTITLIEIKFDIQVNDTKQTSPVSDLLVDFAFKGK